MESASNLVTGDNGVIGATQQSHALSAARVAAPGLFPAQAGAGMIRDSGADVLGFMTAPHQFRDNPAGLVSLG